MGSRRNNNYRFIPGVVHIVNAAAVIDKPASEGSVIRRVAPVAIALTLLIGVMLCAMLFLRPFLLRPDLIPGQSLTVLPGHTYP